MTTDNFFGGPTGPYREHFTLVRDASQRVLPDHSAQISSLGVGDTGWGSAPGSPGKAVEARGAHSSKNATSGAAFFGGDPIKIWDQMVWGGRLTGSRDASINCLRYVLLGAVTYGLVALSTMDPKPSATPTSQRFPWGSTVPPSITSSTIFRFLGLGFGEGTIDHFVPSQCITRLVIFSGPKASVSPNAQMSFAETATIPRSSFEVVVELFPPMLGLGDYLPARSIPVLDQRLLRTILIDGRDVESHCPNVVRGNRCNS